MVEEVEEEEEGGYELAEPGENAELRLRLAAFPATPLPTWRPCCASWACPTKATRPS